MFVSLYKQNEIILYLQNHFNPDKKKRITQMFDKLDICFNIILTKKKWTFQMLIGNSPIQPNFDWAKWNIRSILNEFISLCAVMNVPFG